VAHQPQQQQQRREGLCRSELRHFRFLVLSAPGTLWRMDPNHSAAGRTSQLLCWLRVHAHVL
jgi:hypothetical protein